MNKGDCLNEYYIAQEELEKEYGPQSIVLMMVGSFYEIYGVDLPSSEPPVKIGRIDDAHDILGMNMTMKSKARPHSKSNPFMMGFPDYALDEHLGKFLRANMTVAIYDQYDFCYTDKEGNKKTRKKRKKTHVYTPSTFIDDTLIETNNLLVCGIEKYKSSLTGASLKKVHVAVLSLSTGKAYLLEAYDSNKDTGKAESELYRFIHTYNPSEIIYCGKPDKKFSKIYDLGSKKVYYREIKNTFKKPSYQNEFLKSVYNVDSLLSPIEYIGMEKHSAVLPYFIQALQFAFEQDKLVISRIQKPTFVESRNQLVLNNDSIYQLNLIQSPLEHSISLYDIVCKAKTAMGKRRVRERLLTPYMDVDELEKSYDMVEKMQTEHEDYNDLLRGIADLEKKYRKMVLKTLHPYELADLKDTWSATKKLLKLSSKRFKVPKRLKEDFECFYNEYMGNFDFGIMKQCKLKDIRGSFFLQGVNEELDKLTLKIQSGKKILYDMAREMSGYIEDGNVSFVKLACTETEGWYLTTTKTRFKKIANFSYTFDYNGKTFTVGDDNFELTNLKNSVKIRSPEIRRISRDINSLKSRMNDKIISEYLLLLEHYAQDYGETFITLSNLIADIDFVYSAAKVANDYGYTRPIIKDSQGSYVKVNGLRHPIVEQINDEEEYTTNDISLGLNKHYGSVIYGLNMSGKSTLLKALGCNIVMAQAGMFTSCNSLQFYPFRNLFSKMTIRDNMAKGQSTFMVEMLEVKNMLMRADSNTLVLSDELCSSTESTSAHAIVAETLHALTEKKAKFLFSTHLHELQNIDLVTENPHIKIYHFKVHIDGNVINFDRKLELGGMTELYGLEVARALGLPESFMRGAFSVRDKLTGQNPEILSTKESRYCSKKYVHKCDVCGSTKDLHTHHIRHQAEADENGLIDKKFHKNRKFNLQVLCEKCHVKEHAKN